MHMHPLNEWMMDQISRSRREQFMAEAEQAARLRALGRRRRQGDFRRVVGAAMIRIGYRVAGQPANEWVGTERRLPSAG